MRETLFKKHYFIGSLLDNAYDIKSAFVPFYT